MRVMSAEEARAFLAEGARTAHVATTRADGSPHVVPVWYLVDGDALVFTCARDSVKGRNLARDPRCSISVAGPDFDVVLEGTASKVTDPSIVAELARVAADDGWPARVDDSGAAITAEYSAPSAGPPPWHVYRFTPRRATALGTKEPGGATRWDFD